MLRVFEAKALLVALTVCLCAMPAQAQAFRPSFDGPMGEKKIGDHVWVWKTEKIATNGAKMIEADCPIGYVVTGGGYKETMAFGVGSSAPNSAFDGWIVTAYASYSGPNTVTVYAGCDLPSK